jgi:hypothetical protein
MMLLKMLRRGISEAKAGTLTDELLVFVVIA